MRRRTTFVAAGVSLALAAVLTLLGVGDRAGALPDWQAFVLGVVQRLTELLPVSSSGHLILVPWLGDWTYLKEHNDFNQTFDVALHLGTLVAVFAYFRHDIVDLLAAFFGSLARRRIRTPDERLAWAVFVATLPAAIVGAALENPIANHLGEPWQIAIFLAAFAGLLWLADRTPGAPFLRLDVTGILVHWPKAGFARPPLRNRPSGRVRRRRGDPPAR